MVRSGEFVPAPTGAAAIPQTFIDTQGPSVRVLQHACTERSVGAANSGAPPQTRAMTAGEIGQVFGMRSTTGPIPTSISAATSIYGLNLVPAPPRDDDDKKKGDDDDDRLPQRLRAGGPTAQWMAGQFGPGGGPTSIWKIDGRSGAVFAVRDHRTERRGR